MKESSVAYLLGEMDAAQTADFERAMAADPALQAEVDRLRPILTRVDALPGEAWNLPEPPPLRVPLEAPKRRRIVLRPAVAVACAVALLAAGAGLGAWLDSDAGPASRDESPLAPVDGGGASGRVALTGSDGVRLRVSGLPPTRAGQFYELWLLGADQRLVSLGSFRVGDDGSATMSLPLPVDPARFDFFDVSVEPGDGDPGHSGRSVLRGTTRN